MQWRCPFETLSMFFAHDPHDPLHMSVRCHIQCTHPVFLVVGPAKYRQPQVGRNRRMLSDQLPKPSEDVGIVGGALRVLAAGAPEDPFSQARAESGLAPRGELARHMAHGSPYQP